MYKLNLKKDILKKKNYFKKWSFVSKRAFFQGYHQM